jgi:hypothetical protein
MSPVIHSLKNEVPHSSSSSEYSGKDSRTRTRTMGHAAWLLLLLSLTFGELTAQAQLSREYQLKSVFLFNFAQFTDWPPSAFADANSPMVIGILGNDPFGSALEETVHGETIHGRRLIIEHYRRADEIKTCHILFISQSEARNAEEILKRLKGKPILTVADADSPPTAGAMIRFAVESNKVHFRINVQAAQEAGLTLSSRLLRVANAAPSGGAP